MNHLEQLVAEWLEYQGYFVRRNIKVGKRNKGGYECELDIVALDPIKNILVQYETSTDTHSWEKRESRYEKKFAAGKKYIPGLFKGMTSAKTPIIQYAVFLYGSKLNHKVLKGGEVLLVKVLLKQIISVINTRIVKGIIPEQYPLLRMLQLVCEYHDVLFKEDKQAH